MYIDRLLPISQMGGINQSLYTIRGDVFKSILISAETQTSDTTIETQTKNIEALIAKYKASDLIASKKKRACHF
jgi:Four helix bundle sensory module for signal transduction